MATAYASIATATFESDGTPDDLTITKPTGLASGDLMIAVLGGVDPNASWSRTGWTAVDTNANTDLSSRVLFKVADAGDAAASNFAFTLTGATSGDGLVGALVRVTGTAFTDSANIVVNSDHNASATSHTFDNDIEAFGSSLLILAVLSRDDAGGHSGQAIATSNPTWTERADVQSGAFTRNVGMSVATASYTPGGNTGDASVTFVNTEEAVGVLISIKEDTNVTATHAHLSVSPVFHELTGSAGVVASHAHLAVSPVFSAPTVRVNQRNIVNQTKNNVTNITNISKA